MLCWLIIIILYLLGGSLVLIEELEFIEDPIDWILAIGVSLVWPFMAGYLICIVIKEHHNRKKRLESEP